MAVSVLPRQQEMLRYLVGHIEAKGIAPTRQELASAMGQRNKSTAHHMLEELEQRGAIRRTAALQRGIEVIEPITIPRAPDGAPLFLVRIEEAR